MPASYKITAEVSQFKREVRQAQLALQSLDAEAKLNAARLAATGDAENAAAVSAKIFGERVQALNTISESASKGLKSLTDAGQEQSTDFAKLRTAYADAQRALLEFQQEQERTSKQVKETTTDTDQLQQSLKKIESGVTFSSLKSQLDSVSNIVQKIVGYFQDIEEKTNQYAAQAKGTFFTSQETGLNVDTVQRIQSASKYYNTDESAIVKAYSNLEKKAREQAIITFVDETAKAMYGMRTQNSNGETLDTTSLFFDALDKIAGIRDTEQRNKIANELLGSSFDTFSSIQAGGVEQWKSFLSQAQTISETQTKILKDLDDSRIKLEEAKEAREQRQALQIAGGQKQILDLKAEWYSADTIKSFQNWLYSDKALEDSKNPISEILQNLENGLYEVNEAGKIGLTASAEEAYRAGANLASAFVRGASSVSYAPQNTTYNSTQNFGDTIVYQVPAGSELNEQIAANHRRQAAGYGG